MGSSVYDFTPDSKVAADGRFQITGASGRVQLDALTADLTLKSVTLDGRDITDEALHLTGTDSVSGVIITLTDKVTMVAGHVRDRNGQLVRNYVVVLLPRDSNTGSCNVAKNPHVALGCRLALRNSQDAARALPGSRCRMD